MNNRLDTEIEWQISKPERLVSCRQWSTSETDLHKKQDHNNMSDKHFNIHVTGAPDWDLRKVQEAFKEDWRYSKVHLKN